jgi:long-chain fatty acid transport protein
MEKYRDSWMFSIGGQYALGDAWTLRAGWGYDQSPVTDAYRDAGVPESDRTMLGLGAGVRLSETSRAGNEAELFGRQVVP